jgi:hypothetical protein
MTIDLSAARAFMATHARILDRRRFLHLLGEGEPSDLLAALETYRNSDGGYGWGLEPDLRSPESQPGGALHAFEVFEDIAPATTHRAAELCDWLRSAALGDGGLPFAFSVSEAAGCASIWLGADPAASSLHITAAVAAGAHRVGRHDPAVATHPGLTRVTEYCLDTIGTLDRPIHALELRYVLDFLDTVSGQHDDARVFIDRLGATIPSSGCLHVEGGTDEEMMRPLDFAPAPDSLVRAVLAPDVISADLERLAGLQQSDGGWSLEWTSASPVAALEWRGWLTVRAVSILQANHSASGRTPAGDAL